MWSLGKRNDKNISISPSDFHKIFIGERKIIKTAERIDLLAKELNKNGKRIARNHSTETRVYSNL